MLVMTGRAAAFILLVSLLPQTGTAAEKPKAAPAKVEAAKASPKRIEWATASAPARTAVTEALQLWNALAAGTEYRVPAQKAVDADPNFAFARLLVGMSYSGDEAKVHIDKATELAAKAPEGERRLIEATLLQRARKTDDAVAAYEKLAADYPGEPLVHTVLGQMHLDAGRLESARKELEATVTLEPTSARALSALGNTLLLSGEYASARSRFEAAAAKLAGTASTGGIRNGIARSYVYEGRYAEAIPVYQLAIEEYRRVPSSFPEVGLWNAMARVQLESGHPEASIDTYAKGFESVKTSGLPEDQKQIWQGRLHHGRARSLARMGKKEEAWGEAEIVRKMIAEGGEEGKQFVPSYHYLAGYLKLEAGETEAALEHLKQSLPEHDDFRTLLLARTYEKLGDKVNARKAYQEIVESKQNTLERALAYPEAKKKLS
jgi:tetratricopeptide (TPR) repeat protein